MDLIEMELVEFYKPFKCRFDPDHQYQLQRKPVFK